MISCLNRNGLLFVGDSKMSSQETRAFLQRQKQRYLTPLANGGETAKQLTDWVKKAVDKPEILLKKECEEGAENCRGYSFERDCLDTRQDIPLHWKEQVFVVYSPNYAASLCRGLDQRLQSAKK